jgi:hypothetical protein
VLPEPPGARIGQITCEKAPQSAGAGDGSGSADASADLRVTIPVSTALPDSWKDRVSLTVTAVLRGPRGYPPPLASAPTPPPQYIDRRATASGSAGLTLGPAQLGGGLSRPVGAEELSEDVSGSGSSRVTWVVDGKGRELAGSYDFGFVVDEDASRYAWVEVTAELTANRGRSFFRSPVRPGEAVFAAEPLLDKDAAQAGVTLTLREGSPGGLFFVGRPLDLPLTAGPDGFAVPRGRGAAVTGAIRWDDDAGGRAGYTWVQLAPSPVVQPGDGPPAVTGPVPVLIEPGSELRAPGGMSLTATYDIAQAPEWAAEGTLPAALDVDVVIDGAVAATHTTPSDYVTVGRSHRDICIDRPDISRSHGAFQLSAAGWTYCQQSSGGEAQVLRGDQVIARVGQDQVAAVQPGDVVRLTPKVSLVLR